MINATTMEIEPIGGAEDYARYDRIWQRVAPEMTPYPAVRKTAVAKTEGDDAMTALPGAEGDPCCMGSEAREMTAVIAGFAGEEAGDGAAYQQIARFAPNRVASSALRELARGAEHRSRELRATYYLITGENSPGSTAAVVLPRLPYRELLRNAYHAAACNALNYARAEESTPDICLQRLLRRFSQENYAASDRVLQLLAQSR